MSIVRDGIRIADLDLLAANRDNFNTLIQEARESMKIFEESKKSTTERQRIDPRAKIGQKLPRAA